MPKSTHAGAVLRNGGLAYGLLRAKGAEPVLMSLLAAPLQEFDEDHHEQSSVHRR